MAKVIDVRDHGTCGSKFPLKVVFGDCGEYFRVENFDSVVMSVFDPNTMPDELQFQVSDIDSMIKALNVIRDEVGVPREADNYELGA